jgi:enterochelin esterase family protein
VAAGGTPLVEPDETGPSFSLVTFLWRAGGVVENVVLYGGWSRFQWSEDLSEMQLVRLGATDCWYRTYRMPNALRARYWFGLNDSLQPWTSISRYDDAKRRLDAMVADPLNPTVVVGAHVPVASVVSLPNAPAQPWGTSRPGVARGTLQSEAFHSEVLGNERTVWTYLPPGYSKNGSPCHMLVVFDGEMYVGVVPTPMILDNLLAAERVPGTVAVFVANAGATEEEQAQSRIKELLCDPPFADFLAHELVPWIRGRYNVSVDPQHATIAGTSNGGLAAAYTGLRHPDVFGNVLSQSGAFAWKGPPNSIPPDSPVGEEWEAGWIIREYAAGPRKDLCFYVDVGVFDLQAFVDSNRRMRDVLRAMGYPLHYAEFCGGHDFACWRGTFAEGLLALQELRRAKP